MPDERRKAIGEPAGRPPRSLFRRFGPHTRPRQPVLARRGHRRVPEGRLGRKHTEWYDLSMAHESSERRPVQERARRTRARILDLAAAEFARAGYDGASLNGIVRKSGLTKGAFYFHFRSKEDLALAVFRAKQAELVSGIRKAARPGDDALAQLRAMLRARARLLTEEPSLRCFLRIASDLGLKFGPGSEFAQTYEVPIRTFTGVVRRGQREGGIRRSLKPRAAAQAIFSALLGADELTKMLSGGADLRRRTDDWMEVMLVGLRAPEPRSSRPRRVPRS